MSNEVVVKTADTALSVGLSIANVADLRAFASDVASSGILGQITPTQAEVSLVAMRDDGISIVEFKRKYQWVGQELAVRPNWLLGEFKRRGGKYTIHAANRTACDMTFKSADGDEYRLCITLDDAKEMGLVYKADGKTLKTNWEKFPDDMLFARVCGKALRRVAPELMGGVYTNGEAMDFTQPPAPHYTPQTVVAAVKAVSQSPVAEEPKAEPVAAEDFGVCPCGSVKGKRWEELPTEMLEKIIASKAKALTAEHKNAIVAELGRREEAEAGEALEPEVVE